MSSAQRSQLCFGYMFTSLPGLSSTSSSQSSAEAIASRSPIVIATLAGVSCAGFSSVK